MRLALLLLALTLSAFADEAATRIEYDRNDHGIVTGHGSAFFLDLSAYGYVGKNYLLTAAHNVMGKDGKAFGIIRVELADKSWTAAQPLYVDQGLDICLLSTVRDNASVAKLADKDAKKDEPVTLVASPRGEALKSIEGKIEQRWHEGRVVSKVALPFDHGCSGGGLFSKTGALVGMAVSGIPLNGDLDHTCGLFLPASCIDSFLDEHRRINEVKESDTSAHKAVSIPDHPGR